MQPHDSPFANPSEEPAGTEPQDRTNGWGLSGFVVSLVGIVLTCGLLCPLGVLLSVIGLLKRPRGWAVAGLMLGLAGSMMAASVVALGLFSIRVASALKEFPEEVATAASLGNAMQRIEEARAALKRLPDGDEAEDLIGDLRDGWDRPLRYQPVGDANYELRSAGPDGQFGTPDDKTLDNLDALSKPRESPQIELEVR